MNTQTTTPPVYQTLFPLEENRHLVDKLAAEGHKIFIFGKDILFEGTQKENAVMREIMTGGVTAY